MLNLMILPVLFACLNRLRGTWSWFAHVYGLAIAAILFVNTWQWQAWLVYLAFIMGESFGWGSLFGLVRSEFRSDRQIGFSALFTRGVIWWAPVLLIAASCGCNPLGCISGIYALALAFPLLVEHSPDVKAVGGWWKMQEIFYGAFCGLIFALILLTK